MYIKENKNSKSNTTVFILVAALLVLAVVLLLSQFYSDNSLSSEDSDFEGMLVNSDKVKGDKERKTVDLSAVSDEHPLVGIPTLLDDTLEINISEESMKVLRKDRKRALKTGVLSNPSFVSASVSYGGSVYKAQVRLKGDLSDHWKYDEVSYRIKLKGQNFIYGMKEFSIQHPRTRQYLGEWIYHKLLQKMGVLTTRYGFVRVRINGGKLICYALEEAFSRELMERQQRSEGIILGFVEDLLWQKRTRTNFSKGPILQAYESWQSMQVRFWDNKRIAKRENLKNYANRAKAMLEGVKTGRLQPKDVFDYRVMANFIAASEFCSAKHSFLLTNIRFYYNPLIGKIEPIGYDGNVWDVPLFQLAGEIYGEYLPEQHFTVDSLPNIRQLFQDVEFYSYYFEALQYLAAPGVIEEFVEELKLEEETLVQPEFIGEEGRFKWENLLDGLHNLRSILKANAYIHARFASPSKGSKSDYVELEIGNLGSFPIKLKSVVIGGLNLPFSQEVPVLKSKSPSSVVRYIKVKLPMSIPYPVSKPVELKYSVYGLDRELSASIEEAEIPVGNSIPVANIDVLKEIPFIKVNDTKKLIKFKPGEHLVSEDIVFPAGYKVIIPAKTVLKFGKNVVMLSYAPIVVNGKAEREVVFTSIDKEKPWAGLMVTNAASESKVKHLIVENTAGIIREGWYAPGGVTFFASDVIMQDCLFRDNRGEDMLNMARNKFLLLRCTFERSYSDAFDADFSEGKIKNSKFLNCKNDGIDVSGSDVLVSDTRVYRAGDKGVSMGEGSRAVLRNVTVEYSNIGVAAKDLSYGEVEGGRISNNNIGFTTYIKKKMFGYPVLKITKTEMKNNTDPFLSEKHTRLLIDGKKISDQIEGVYDILLRREGKQ